MKKLKIVAIATVFAIAGLTAVHAGPYANKQKQCKQMQQKKTNMQTIFEQLNLSNEQKTALQANRQEMRQSRQAMYAQMKAKRTQGQFVSVNGFDKQGFIDAQMHRVQMRADMHAQRFEKTMQILTPEQKVKFVALLKEQNK